MNIPPFYDTIWANIKRAGDFIRLFDALKKLVEGGALIRHGKGKIHLLYQKRHRITKINCLHSNLTQLMEAYENPQMERTELGRFCEFSVGVRVGTQFMLEMLKEL